MGNLDFQLTKEKLTDGSSVALLHMKGSIDGTTVKKFESKTLGLYEEGIKYLILNFFEIGYMNSTGLGILVKVLDKFQEKDGDVKLVKVPRKVADLFDMLGISSIVTIYPNMEDAIGSLPFPIQSATPIVPAPEILKGKSTSMPLPPKVNVAVVQPKSDDLFQDSGIVIAPDDLVGISISPEPELSIDQPAPISSEESLEGGIAIDAEWDTAPEENTNKETLSSSTAAEFFEISPMEDSISEPVETTNTNNLDMGIDLSNIGENIEATTISAEEEQSGDKSIDWNLDLGGATQETTSESPTDISNIFKEVIESSQEETTVPETLDLSDAFEEVSEAIQEEPATPEIPDLSDAFEEAAEVAQEEPATSEIPDLPEAAQEEPAAPEIPDLSEAIEEIQDSIQEEPAAPEIPDLSEAIDEIQDSVAEQEESAASEIPDLSAPIEEIQDSESTQEAPPSMEEEGLLDALKDGISSPLSEKKDPQEEESSLPELPDFDEAMNKVAEEISLPGFGKKQESEESQEETAATQNEKMPGEAFRSISSIEDTDFLETQVSSGKKSLDLIPTELFAPAMQELPKDLLEKAVSELEDDAKEESKLEKKEDLSSSSRESRRESRSSAVVSKPSFSAAPAMPLGEEKDEDDVSDDVVNAFRDSEEHLLADRKAKEEQSKKAATKVKTSSNAPQVKSKAPFKRKTTVQYYEQMNPSKSYPLSVIISKDKVGSVQITHVAQKEGKKELSISADKPKITVTPVISGCHIAPPSITLDVTQEVARADFWVTPIVESTMHGWIDIVHQGETIDRIDIHTKSVKQTWAKIAAVASILSPFFSTFMEGFFAQKESLRGLPRFLMDLGDKIGGLYILGIVGMALFLGAGAFLYFKNLPKEAQTLEKFFGTE